MTENINVGAEKRKIIELYRLDNGRSISARLYWSTDENGVILGAFCARPDAPKGWWDWSGEFRRIFVITRSWAFRVFWACLAEARYWNHDSVQTRTDRQRAERSKDIQQ